MGHKEGVEGTSVRLLGVTAHRMRDELGWGVRMEAMGLRRGRGVPGLPVKNTVLVPGTSIFEQTPGLVSTNRCLSLPT